MEFPVINIQTLFNKDVCCITSNTIARMPREKIPQITTVIDSMGIASAKAQGLPQTITTTSKLMSSDHRLYVAVLPPKAVSGILKVGRKKLFIREASGEIKEIEPLCVLDFYVHESLQRQGIGAILFRRMLMNEKAVPHRLGYDRPSPKLLGFLNKHYRLNRYTPQPNNFVVFRDYFESDKSSSSNSRPSSPRVSSARSNSAPALRESKDSSTGVSLSLMANDRDSKQRNASSSRNTSILDQTDILNTSSKTASSGRRRTPSTLDDYANSSLRISSSRLDQSLNYETANGLNDSSVSRRTHSLNTSLNASILGTQSHTSASPGGLSGAAGSNQQRWKSGLNPPYALSFQGSNSFSGPHSSVLDSDAVRSKQTDYSHYNQKYTTPSALNSSLRSSSNGPIPARSGDPLSAREHSRDADSFGRYRPTAGPPRREPEPSAYSAYPKPQYGSSSSSSMARAADHQVAQGNVVINTYRRGRSAFP